MHHLRLQVLLVFLDLRYLVLLVLQLFLGIVKFLFLVVEPVYLGLELVGLLLLDHLDVPLGDFLDLGEAGVAEPVADQADLRQGRVLVQRLQEDRLNRLTEEVVLQHHHTDLLVELQGVDQIDQTSVVQPAA